MDRAVRLADFLAGELDPDEQTAVEAELARDPALRADLEVMRTADDHLAMIAPVRPPSGFEERLDAAIDRELAQTLGHSRDTTEPALDEPPHEPSDELAARRARTASGPGLPRWVTAVSAAAAALVVLGGAGIVFSDTLGGMDNDDEAVQTQALDTLEREALDGDAEVAPDAVADRPRLVGGDRLLDDQDIEALLGDPAVFGIADRDLDGDAARELAAPFAEALGAGPAGAAGQSREADEGDDAASDEAANGQADDGDAAIAEDAPDAPASEQSAPGPQRGVTELALDPDVSAADRAQVGACLELLLSDTPDVIPTYAELIVYDGDDAIVFGLVTEDPATGRFTRREAWIVDRDTCEVRLFTQR